MTEKANNDRAQTIGLLGVLAAMIGAILTWLGGQRAAGALEGRDYSLSGSIALGNFGLGLLIFGLALMVAGLVLWGLRRT